MKTWLSVPFLFVLSVSAPVSRAQAPASPAAPAPASSGAASTTTPAARSSVDPAKAADIQKLLEVAGIRKLMADTMDGMLEKTKPTLEQALPPGEYRDKLIALFLERLHSKMNIQQFIDVAAAAYDKYFSDEDIKALIAFYQTPLGQRTLTVLPKLTVELQSQGMQIGQEAGRQSMIEVLAEHPELAKAMQDASTATH